MTFSDSTTSAIRQLLTFGGAILTGLGITNLEQAASLTNDLVVAIPALVSIGSVVWSIVAHYKMKKVPVAATAIILPGPKPEVGSNLDLTPLTGKAKVVG